MILSTPQCKRFLIGFYLWYNIGRVAMRAALGRRWPMRFFLVSLCILAGAAQGGEVRPQFTKKLTTARAGEKVRIEFAVSRQTDVGVSILDSQGKVVRHLAAGVLGYRAPAPLKKGSPDQSLEWDGRDDLGRAAVGGPFNVRVGLGLTPVPDGSIGFAPGGYNPLATGAAQSLDAVRALATAPNGELMVFHLLVNPGAMLCSVSSLSFSRPAGLLNIGSRFYDVKQGKFVGPPDRAVASLLRSSPGNESSPGSFGLDGNYYFQLAHATMRLGPDLKALPFPKGECDAGKYGAEVKRYYGGYDKYGGLCGLGGTVYVGDRLNRRVVKAKLGYAAEEVCAIR
jgi:hypothetical protein